LLLLCGWLAAEALLQLLACRALPRGWRISWVMAPPWCSAVCPIPLTWAR